MAAPKKSNATITDVPLKELKAFRDETGGQQVNLQIQRRTTGNKRAFVTPQKMTPVDDLISGAIMEWLAAYAGGGNYVFLARDPVTMDTVAPRWEVSLPGHPKNATAMAQGVPVGQLPQPPMGGSFPQQPGAMPGTQQPMFGIPGMPAPGALPAGTPYPSMLPNGSMSPPPQAQLPGWARGYPVQQQWGMFYDRLRQEGKLGSGASMHSDQLAQHWAMQGDARQREQAAENAQLRERLSAQEKANTAEREKLAAELARIEREAIQKAADARYDALRAEMVSIRERPEAPKTDWGPIIGGIASVATAIVPALISAGVQRQTAQLNASTEQAKAGQEQTALLLAATNKPTDWGAITALAAPLIPALLQSFGPQAKTEAEMAAVEQRMMLFKMIGDMMLSNAQAQGDVPKWMPLVESAIEAAGAIGTQVMANRAANPPGALPRAGAPAVQPPPPSGAEDDPAIWERLAQVDQQAAQMVKLVWDNIPRDAGFHTHEWRMILFNIHMKVQPVEITPMVVRHLLHCHEYHLLPAALEEVFAKPESLEPVLRGLPIAQMDAEYTEAIIGALTAEIKAVAAQLAEEAASEAPPNGAGHAEPAPGSTVEVAKDVIDVTPAQPAQAVS